MLYGVVINTLKHVGDDIIISATVQLQVTQPRVIHYIKFPELTKIFLISFSIKRSKISKTKGNTPHKMDDQSYLQFQDIDAL